MPHTALCKNWIFIGAIKTAVLRPRSARNDPLLALSTNTFDAVCQENSAPRLPVSVTRRIGSRAVILTMACESFQRADQGAGRDWRCRFVYQIYYT
jgi:hypothetical protein